VAQPSGGAAAAAAELPEVDELERKRMQVAEELRLVEKQASIGKCWKQEANTLCLWVPC
jgi:hypothetical protein